MIEIWDLWFPNAGATGLSFARCRVGADAAADRVLVHAAPRRLEVTVRDEQGAVVAEGRGLRRRQPGPMSLPGGEAGILTAWWHAPDHSEWRWQLELSNCRHAEVGVVSGTGRRTGAGRR